DVFRGESDLFSVNLAVNVIDSGTTDAHPDFFQFYNPDSTVDNVILYNTRVYGMGAQGLFGGPGQMRNIAFVNLLMEKRPADSDLISQFTGDWDHVLLWHLTTADAGIFLRETAQMRNVFIVDNNLASLIGDATMLSGFHIDYNRIGALSWDMTDPLGTHVSVGDQGFRDAAHSDYHPASGGPVIHAGTPLPGVPA